MKFRNEFIISLAAVFALSSCGVKTSEFAKQEPVDYVSTLVGTLSKYSLSTGNNYPATARPWGMNFWTPQTGKMGDGWTYSYTEDKIRGFKQTHQPSPWINDYGQFSIMPESGTEPVFDEDKRASWFSHKSETAKPHYYSTYLADYDIVAELTPTERAAAFRVTYPEAELSYLVVDAFDKGSYAKIIPSENKIIGYTTRNSGGVPENFKNYFVIVSDTPFDYYKVVNNAQIIDGTESASGHSGAVVGFRTARGQQVNFRIASSFISFEQAEQNLLELGDGNFDRLLAEGRDRWNEVLGRITVEDDNIDNLRTFYSCLFRSVLFPRDLSEVTADGRRVHYSPFTGEVCDGYMFTDTGFWDTFRALFPLLNLVYPEMNVKMQEGLVNDWKESGFLPEWASPGHRGCMVGNNSASIVADAYMKGLRGYDIEALWDAVISGAHKVHPTVSSTGRLGWEYYDRLGYVPNNVGINESAARTLEYAYNDWCIWTLGKALGKSEEELAPYRKAAENYKNLFYKDFSLMSGRAEDGSFPENFNPLKWGGDFTEGNSLHYTWSVFHDIAGLVALMGGEENFNRQLDEVFEMPPHFDDSYYGFTIHEIREMQIMNMGNYAHGNQPIQHMLYLYDWSGQPYKAQKRIREVMDKLYSAAPDGYCGDEDNGQTSSWYVFSAMGFYPVCPGSNQYAIGTPLFKRMTINLSNGKKVNISAKKNSSKNFYVKGMKLNGRAYDKAYLSHEELAKGADIVFDMSSSPNTEWAVSADSRPYSMSLE